MLVYGIGFMISFIFQCRPLSYSWNQWDGEHEGVCEDAKSATYGNASLNIFFDIVVMLLPVPKLLALQSRSTRSKIGVVLIFLVGLFVTACSIVRLHYVPYLWTSQNPTYDFNDITLWSGLEGDVGVCCACMPMVAGPVLYFFREKVGSRLSKFTKSNSSKSTVSISKPPKMHRMPGGDKSLTRLPSNASERDLEMNEFTGEHGGIQKTSVTSVYNLPPIHSSDGDERLIAQGQDRMPKSEWD